QDLPGVVLSPSNVGRAVDEDVSDRERRVEGECRVVAARANLLGPDPARDVDQDAAAVALAVDVSGAVEHLLEVVQRQLHGGAAGSRVLADGRVDRAGVAVLDAGRRDAGPIGPLRRKASLLVGQRQLITGRAEQSDLPVSAPSSSGRATGTNGSAV